VASLVIFSEFSRADRLKIDLKKDLGSPSGLHEIFSGEHAGRAACSLASSGAGKNSAQLQSEKDVWRP
jgi:hypothetical protein